MATHIIGTYDFDNHKVNCTLVPIEISKQESYVLHNVELLHEASTLFAEIQELNNRIKVVKIEKVKPQTALLEQPTSSIKIDPTLPDAAYAVVQSYRTSETPVVWKDVEENKTQIKRWLNTDATDDFFNMGGLKQMMQFPSNPKFNGTDDERAKHDKLQALSYSLMLLDVRTNYLKTFEEMCFIPLAIQNISPMQDSDIRVVVNVEIGEIVEPHQHLIWEEYEGLQGALCRDDDEKDVGIICELFGLNEDGFIHIEDVPSMFIPKVPIFTTNGLSLPDKTEEDYKDELEEFIASTGGRGYYEFDVTSLRPGECRWLCCGMLIRPVDGKVKVHYQIHSSNSTGDLNGRLETNVN